MKPLISLIQFSTILPLGKPQDLESFARHSYLYPIAGYLIGGIVALAVFFIADHTIAAAIAIAGLLLLTGAHHFDGLLDLGDALMAHGDREKRIKALTDIHIGAGGVALGIAITVLLFAGLQATSTIVYALIIGEVCAKFSMAFLTAYGVPFRQGIHSYIHQFSHAYYPVLAAVLCIPLLLLPVSPMKLAGGFVMMILCPTVLLLISRRMFGGVNGDIVGASNEITRACVIVAMALI
ncbi:adenosylcobinamide-GDP ribazoletransferase [uncultured Methanoregula sp.]|uniref:adenosylcobinamide-GDP ribazoletransferase n=1 Tax=uncultured Methanoregula sp. TaxID=1005933 RepID=UPI0037495DE0